MENTEYIRFVDMFADTVYRVALNYCKNKYDADDVVQNTFLKLLQTHNNFNDDEYVRRCLIRVAVLLSSKIVTLVDSFPMQHCVLL